MSMRSLVNLVVSLCGVAGMFGCTSDRPPTADEVCDRYVPGSILSREDFVGANRRLGPTASPARQELSTYPDAERMVLCLRPSNGAFQVAGITSSDKMVHVLWTQNTRDGFTKPI
jgi:hypothetical protein